MLLRISVALSALIYLALIPALEIGPTHVSNPDWPAHARLHEVWQLTSNALLSLLALWLVWRTSQASTGGLIAFFINIGFLAAYFSAETYGGSMVHSDGSELLVFGVNPALAVVALVTVGIAMSLVRHPRQAA
ncbi:hypothetical protein [Erythrobacter mangrovi]|uniref:DUF4383 domain-containing protein n=1 Tax=Erythrobacter mangrovi TaxID=2739433 RepID=A0A7D3X913_9SPHN|nr:hypothetical protein [Erythrobacter mangrovi]QKG70635.1 hypothetical protein HQR01_04195 [Erythrobacter mangrovi]